MFLWVSSILLSVGPWAVRSFSKKEPTTKGGGYGPLTRGYPKSKNRCLPLTTALYLDLMVLGWFSWLL